MHYPRVTSVIHVHVLHRNEIPEVGFIIVYMYMDSYVSINITIEIISGQL